MLNNFFKKLDQLQRLIFSFYIQRDFGSDRFSQENILLKRAQSLMQALQKTRKRFTNEKLINHLELMYEIIFSLSLLKNRLIDHSTFEICERELKAIAHCLTEAFSTLSTEPSQFKKHSLDVAIQSLEIIFSNALQVVTADPMIFLFFIQDLYSLSKSLDNFRALEFY